MSKKNARGRHRVVTSHGGAAGRRATLVALASGLMLSMAVPAQTVAIAPESRAGTGPATISSAKEIPDRTAAPVAPAYTVKAGDALSPDGRHPGLHSPG